MSKIPSTGVAIVSGGMDSVTLAHLLRPTVDDFHMISVDYGQRHSRELHYALMCANDLEAQWHLVNLTSITALLDTSALTNPEVEVPEGHYAEDTMRITVVPNRNALMLDVAVAVAVAKGARFVGTAVHAGDHAVYPDCRPEFIQSFERTALLANEGFIADHFHIAAPFIDQTKADIARMGNSLGVDWTRTWSCYKGGEVHCGSCSTCFERREAFQLAGVTDPTEYLATPHYEAPVG